VNEIAHIFEYVRGLFYAVVMDSRMLFSRHIDVTVGKALAMLGFMKRLSGGFRVRWVQGSLYS
jgi:hypothetical protein